MADPYQVVPQLGDAQFGAPLDFSDPTGTLPQAIGQATLGDALGGGVSPDPSGSAPGGRMPLDLPAQPQSWGAQNPTLPSQLSGWLRNYYGGVGTLGEDLLDSLVLAAKGGGGGFTWNTAHGGSLGHGNDGLPDGGANLPPDGVLGGAGTGPARYGGSGDLSEPQPTWLGTVNPTDLQTWGKTAGAP
jgi:hypothetical protein